MKRWTLPAEDQGDDPIVVTTDGNLDLPTLNLELLEADRMYSPAQARRLAMLLNSAADYAESCVKVTTEIGAAS